MILKGAGAKMWLACGTLFYSHPRSVYRSCAMDNWDYIQDGLQKGTIGGYYNEGHDYWTADLIGSITGWTRYVSRRKYSYEKMGIGLNLEIYDIDIANRRLKNKETLVRLNRSRLAPSENPSVSMFKIKIG